MSSHFVIPFDEVVKSIATQTVESLGLIVSETKTFIKEQITDHLKFYRQLSTYEGVPTTPFWQGMLPNPEQMKAPGKSHLVMPTIEQTPETSATIEPENLTSQQQVVLNRLKNIAAKQGYEIKALPSPSGDLVIDFFQYDVLDKMHFQREKVAIKRRKNETDTTPYLTGRDR